MTRHAQEKGSRRYGLVREVSEAMHLAQRQEPKLSYFKSDDRKLPASNRSSKGRFKMIWTLHHALEATGIVVIARRP